MDDWLEKYSKSRKITSQYSLASMKSNLKRVEKVIKKDIKDWKIKDFENPEKILDDLVENYSLNTAIVSMSAIKSWLIEENAKASLIEEYTDYIKELTHEKESIVNQQEKTDLEKELDENFEWKNLTKKVKDYIEKNIDKNINKNDLTKLLLIGLYTLQPPARIGNYLNMEIRKGDGKKLSNDKNYLMLKDGKYKFIFNKYKTSKHLGKVELPVTDPLLTKLITKHIEDKKGRVPIFLNLTQSQVTQFLNSISKKILGVPVSVNVFRHSFLSDFMKRNPSIKEKKEIASIVGQKYRIPRMEKYSRIE